MSLVQEVVGLPFEWNDRTRAPWMAGQAPEPDILDIRIDEEPGGYVLFWIGRDPEDHGSSVHESLALAERRGEVEFGVAPGHWAKAVIRRAVERSFPADVRGVLASLCALRKGYQAQANALVLADGQPDRLRGLLELISGDRREDLRRFIDWKHNHEKDALTPEEIARRFEALGLPVPELVAEQVKERRARGR